MNGGQLYAGLDLLAEAAVVLDAGDRVIHANPAALRLLGVGAGVLEGAPIEPYVPVRLRRVEGVSFYRYLLGRAEHVGGRALRAPVLRANGVEIEHEILVAPVDLGGPVPGIVATLRRPREPLAFEADSIEAVPEAPPDEGSLYRAVFDRAPIGIFHFDARGVITDCNATVVATLGSSKRIVIGLDMRTLPNAGVVAALEEALAGRPGSYEGDYRSATSGKQTTLRIVFSPMIDHGRVAGGIGMLEDVTERKRIEERLAEADRMASLGTVAAGVAHEINNPLAYVRAGLDLASRELSTLRAWATHGSAESAGLRRVAETLASCRDGVERVRSIVSDLKAFSRGDDGKTETVDLERCIDSAINLVWNEIRHRAALTKDFSRISPVLGVEARFVQVFVNLLVNAAQAIPVGNAAEHRIEVRTCMLDGGRVAVEVSDTGCGISEENLERIFEPFWTDKAQGIGTGLGLAICHGIVAAAGGEITVSSEAGQGTTFRVTLPVAPERASAAPLKIESAPPESGVGAHGKARVLIVDDETKLAWTLRVALGDKHEVETVASGRAAVDKLLGGASFDLILCDLMMPELSGMDVHALIAQHRPDLLGRCVFMTGGAFTDRARAFLQDPSVRRIEKPFLIEDVEALLPVH